ncbi:PGAM [Seminavis robusta]|uniref:PGAM n=1 Tax=Seminavis robusta TaxID=568900 RepID=A0A9N8D4C4_9STRA|nr:PGAM [Seminavis robusta]|eukprot:Sro2_g001780.1 PGAM (254) ;mRNA; f:245263-246024
MDDPRTQKRLICIRHARSEGNEFMARPGNEWGDATFRDDPDLIDAKLTPTGMKQVQEELLPKFQAKDDDDDYYVKLLRDVDLILVSPLTRTQQTFQYGVLPALKQHNGNNNLPPILAHALASERVYTASDTGRYVQELAQEFPWVDWSIIEGHTDQKWWYTGSMEEEFPEWRPFGQGQWYAVPGEPMPVFTERMKALEEWIAAREEQTILLVAHWGVIRYLTGGYESANCEVKVLDNWVPLHQQEEQTTTIGG